MCPDPAAPVFTCTMRFMTCSHYIAMGCSSHGSADCASRVDFRSVLVAAPSCTGAPVTTIRSCCLLPADAQPWICRYTLHIKDLDPQSMSANSWLEDTSKVQKYEMSDEAYNQRENTYRKYKQAKLKVDTATASPSPPSEVCLQPASP